VIDQYGALPFMYGTLVTSAVALFIAVPLGIGAAIFLAELAPPRISDTLQFFIDLLAAVPSVIYGLLGVFIVVPLMRTVIFPGLNKPLGFLPFFKGPSYGVGFLTAGIVLAIMVIPYIISVSREVLLSYHGTSGKRRWHWARHVGNQPGTWLCRSPRQASWVRSFWRWRVLWEKRWP